MGLKKRALGCVLGMSIAAVAGTAADAAVFDWTATGLLGYTITGSGTLDATPLGGGVYQVTNMTGTWDFSTITGLTSYAGDDQLVYATSPHVDFPGLSFVLADGNSFNFYYDTSTTDPYACRNVGYCEIGPGVPGTSGLGPPADATNPISFTLTAVPEPASWAMMLVGIGGLGAALRSRRKQLEATA